jgi:hypothetical protein
MNGLNLAPHLLADEAVVGMALGHGAKFHHVQRFAQVHLHEPTALRDPFDLDVVRFFLNLGEIIFHLHP